MQMSERFNFFVKDQICDKTEKKVWKENEMSRKFSSIVEEKLCEFVCLYPVIYDKLQKGYQERGTVANALEEISQSLELISDSKILLLLGHIQCNFKKELF